MINTLKNVGASLFFVAACSLGSFSSAADENKDPAVDASADLEEQMVGYWAPDPEAMIAEIKKQLGDDPNAEAMIPFIKEMMSKLAVEVKKGEVTIHALGEPQTATYKVKKVDKDTNTITMDVTDDEEVSEGTAIIKGDKLTLGKDGENLVLNRIQKAEFDKRKEAAQQAPAIPGGLE